jgi:hypothetical protein
MELTLLLKSGILSVQGCPAQSRRSNGFGSKPQRSNTSRNHDSHPRTIWFPESISAEPGSPVIPNGWSFRRDHRGKLSRIAWSLRDRRIRTFRDSKRLWCQVNNFTRIEKKHSWQTFDSRPSNWHARSQRIQAQLMGKVRLYHLTWDLRYQISDLWKVYLSRSLRWTARALSMRTRLISSKHFRTDQGHSPFCPAQLTTVENVLDLVERSP